MSQNDHREQLLRLLAEEGARRCSYSPGAGNAHRWPTATCDCKFLGPLLGSPNDVPPGTEFTGCCEIRAAYLVVKEHSR